MRWVIWFYLNSITEKEHTVYPVDEQSHNGLPPLPTSLPVTFVSAKANDGRRRKRKIRCFIINLILSEVILCP